MGRTSYSVFVGRLYFCKDDLRCEWTKHDHPEYHCKYAVSFIIVAAQLLKTRTFIPQTPIAVPDLSLSCSADIKNADAQSQVMHDAIGVLFVEFGNKGLFCGYAKVGWMYWHGVLPEMLRLDQMMAYLGLVDLHG
jgi:hypothetical protein